MNKQTKDLVLGTVVVKDETLERIYGLDEEGIEDIKRTVKELQKENYEIIDFNEYTEEDVDYIRKRNSNRRNLRRIIEITEVHYSECIKQYDPLNYKPPFGNSLVEYFDDEILERVPKRTDLVTILDTLCRIDGMDGFFIDEFRNILTDEMSNRVLARSSIFSKIVKPMFIFNFNYYDEFFKSVGLKELIIKEFIHQTASMINSDLIRSILKDKSNLSTEEKALEIYSHFIDKLIKCKYYFRNIIIFDPGTVQVLKKTGIEEKRLLNQEILDIINNL